MESIRYLMTDNGLIHNVLHLSRNCDLTGRRIEYASMSDVVDVKKSARLESCLHCMDEGESTRVDP
ncbi:MAG TPA: hypothetical protein VFO84_09300 [Dehalococcoidia bacterium]|nr:hypothetical protein [Dehalococcoidia bacterium]